MDNGKNDETKKSHVFCYRDEIAYQTGSIVSKTLIDRKTGTVTLFAFDEGQSLSEHTAPFDALVQVVDGKAVITIGDKENCVSDGQNIIMPANVPHAVRADGPFKMVLIMIRE